MLRKLEEAVKFILSQTEIRPRIGLVLGSGLGPYVQNLTDQKVIPYGKIPHFKNTTVEGHEGKLILGQVNGQPVAALMGRFHSYEGYSMDEVVFPVRVLGLLGVKILILTNAAGGINRDYSPGDLVLIEDHINLSGNNPLVGPNIKELGTRFPDMTHAYDPHLAALFRETAAEMNYPLRSGVYCHFMGPTYETPAEIKMAKTMGGDMVGMSTVPETIAGVHMNLKVAGISCITNLAAGILQQKILHEDIKDVAKHSFPKFSALLNGTIEKIGRKQMA